ncbi:MAG: cation:proton antiporter [Thermoprotei archaeon]
MILSSLYGYLTLVLILGFLFGFLFKRRGLSSSIGYLLAGFVSGLVLGVNEDIKTFMENVEIFAITLLFFEIGFEIHVKRVGELVSFPLYVSLFEVFIAMSMVYGIGSILGLSTTEALVLGLIASFSSTVFTFKLIEDLKPSIDDVKKTVFMVAAVEDVIIVFALAAIEARVIDLSTITKLLAYPVVIYGIAYLLSHKVLNRVLPRDENGVILMIGIGLAFSYLSGLLGLSPALGAFLAGLTFSGIEHAEDLMPYFKSIRGFVLLLYFIGMGISLASIQIAIQQLLLGIVLGIMIVLVHSFATITASLLLSGLGFVHGIETGFYLSTLSELGLILIYTSTKYGLTSPWLYVVVITGITFAIITSNYLVANREKLINIFYSRVSRDILARIERVIDVTRYTASSPYYKAVVRVMHAVLAGLGEALLLTTIVIATSPYLISYVGSPLPVLVIVGSIYIYLYIRVLRHAHKAIERIIEYFYGVDRELEESVEKIYTAIIVYTTLLLVFVMIALWYTDELSMLIGKELASILTSVPLVLIPIIAIANIVYIMRKTR